MTNEFSLCVVLLDLKWCACNAYCECFSMASMYMWCGMNCVYKSDAVDLCGTNTERFSPCRCEFDSFKLYCENWTRIWTEWVSERRKQEASLPRAKTYSTPIHAQTQAHSPHIHMRMYGSAHIHTHTHIARTNTQENRFPFLLSFVSFYPLAFARSKISFYTYIETSRCSLHEIIQSKLSFGLHVCVRTYVFASI